MVSMMSIAMIFGVIVAMMVISMGLKKLKQKKNSVNEETAAPIKNERARFIS